MIILDSKRERKEDVTTGEAPDLLEEQTSPASEIAPPESKKKQKKEEKDATDVNPDDIPF